MEWENNTKNAMEYVQMTGRLAGRVGQTLMGMKSRFHIYKFGGEQDRYLLMD